MSLQFWRRTQLQRPFERIDIYILAGASRSPSFIAEKNRLGKVPVLEWPDGRMLTESNSILWLLAQDSDYLPTDSWQLAEVLRWMFFEQLGLVPYVGTVRFWYLAGEVDRNRAALADRIACGYRALQFLDRSLATRKFLVGEKYSVADIALYAYSHVAHEGGFDLDRYPHLRAWIARVENEPRYIPIVE